MYQISIKPLEDLQDIFEKMQPAISELSHIDICRNISFNINFDKKSFTKRSIDGFLSDCNNSDTKSKIEIYILNSYHFSEIQEIDFYDCVFNVMMYNYGKHFIYTRMQNLGFDVNSTSKGSVCDETINFLSQLFCNTILLEGNYQKGKEHFNNFLSLFDHQIHPSIEGFDRKGFSLNQLINLTSDLKDIDYGVHTLNMISKTKTFQDFYFNGGGAQFISLFKPFLTKDFINDRPEDEIREVFNI